MKKSSLMYDSEYRDMAKTERQLWWYKALRDLLSIYLSGIEPRSKILDAGCGTGKNVEYLRSKGFAVTGVDLSPLAVQLAKKRNKTGIQRSSILSLPFRGSCFDVVICMDVLGSLRTDNDITRANHEFYRVLKPGGLLLIQCAAFEWLRSPHDTVTNFRVRFEKEQLLQFFPEANWKVKKASYRVFFLLPLITLFRIVKRLISSQKHSTDQHVPPRVVNKLLETIQVFENSLFTRINFPVGSSLFVVLEKKNQGFLRRNLRKKS